MLLSEEYKRRLAKLAGISYDESDFLISEAITVADPYSASKNRVKFDINLVKTWIEHGQEMGMVFQANNDKYKAPIWKMRILWPFALGYNKKGQLVLRAVHVEGQSEKKALAHNPRQGSAQAHNEWRLFKVANIKSIFPTGGYFDGPPAGIEGYYNPQDSAMSKVIAYFDRQEAMNYQKTIKGNLPAKKTPTPTPVKQKPIVQKPSVKQKPAIPKTPEKTSVSKNNEKKLKDKIDKLNKLL